MSLTKVKKALKELEKEELQSLLEDLYKKHKIVKQQLDFAFCMSEADLLAQYQKEVTKQLSFKIPRYTAANLAIKECCKFDISPMAQIEIRLTFVALGIKRYTQKSRDGYAPTAFIRVAEQIDVHYEEALKIAYEHHLLTAAKPKFTELFDRNFYYLKDLEMLYAKYYEDGRFRNDVVPMPLIEPPTPSGKKFDYDF